MKSLKRIVLPLFAVAMVAGSALLYTNNTEAQGSAALSITPRKDYTIEPGEGVEDTLVIRNLDSEKELNLGLRAIDFSYTDDGGTPKLMLDEDAPQTTWSLKPFIKLPESITVGPNETKTVPISMEIPENQGAGSFYSAIVYSSGASEGGNVGLSASGVTLAFVTVPGEVDEKLTLEKLGAFNTDTRKYQRFTLNMPQRIGYTLNNEGNVVGAPVGEIVLRDTFGRETGISDINPDKSLALIGQTRTFESCILKASEEVSFNGSRQEASMCVNPSLWPGFYSVAMDAMYGQNGNLTQEIQGKSWFIYAPWWFVLIVVVVLAYVSYRIYRVVRYIQNRKNGGAPAKPKRAKSATKK